jgi:hypothetical protein
MQTRRASTTITGVRAIGEIFLIGTGASLALALVVAAVMAGTPPVRTWVHAWAQQRAVRYVHEQCGRHNGIDPSPYHLRSRGEEAIMAQCLARHLPR